MNLLNPLFFERFQKFRGLYNSEQMGAGKILKNYLGLSQDIVLPITHPHGVQYFGRRELPLDIQAVDPIYWATNEDQKRDAQKIKPSALLPHPIVLLTFSDEAILKTSSESILVVGPPPGPFNDVQLLNNLRRRGIRSCSILVKERGVYTEKSKQFWTSNGATCCTAGPTDSDFYLRLYRILSKFELIVFCTASSAIIFAAMMGKQILLLEDYKYRCYDVYPEGSVLDYYSLNNANINLMFSFIFEKNLDGYQKTAKHFLGFNNTDKGQMEKELHDTVSQTENLLYHYFKCRGKFVRGAIDWLAVASNKTPLHSRTLLDYIRLRLKGKTYFYFNEVNEISVILDGCNSSNLTFSEASIDRRKGRWPGCGA